MFKKLISWFTSISFDVEPVIGSYFDRHPEHHPDKKPKKAKPKPKAEPKPPAAKKAKPE